MILLKRIFFLDFFIRILVQKTHKILAVMIHGFTEFCHLPDALFVITRKILNAFKITFCQILDDGLMVNKLTCTKSLE